MKKKTINAADLFCGAGGTSQGLLMAANELDADLSLVAVNHWNIAIDTHSVNHPYAKHCCTGIDSIDPRKLVPGGRLDVLCASPECTHHSVARGGKPMSDQSRSTAWHILRFAEALYIKAIVIENVPEFESWGPLGANGRPLKSKRGQLFASFVASLRAAGYRVERRVLNCADYGDPTTRRRLFILARRDGRAIHWPEPTHIPAAEIECGHLFTEHRKPWRAAREIIDWSTPSQSIFERKKPLAPKTLRRIEVGLKRFCGLDVDLGRCMAENLRPFLVIMRGTGTAASIDEPAPTVTAGGQHIALVQPFLAQWDQQSGGDKVRGVDGPMPTVVTKANTGVVEPFLLGQQSCAAPRGMDDPVPTIATAGAVSLTEPFIMPHSRKHDQPQSIDRPLRTVTATSSDLSLVQPFLIAYYGTQNMSETADPLPTVTTKERFGLVEVKQAERYQLDIRFRMLQPRELARAQGFPDTYQFTGNREDVVKQIGNAVPPHTAKALLMEVLQ